MMALKLEYTSAPLTTSYTLSYLKVPNDEGYDLSRGKQKTLTCNDQLLGLGFGLEFDSHLKRSAVFARNAAFSIARKTSLMIWGRSCGMEAGGHLGWRQVIAWDGGG